MFRSLTNRIKIVCSKDVFLFLFRYPGSIDWYVFHKETLSKVIFMSEAVSTKKSQTGNRWLNIAKRILAGVVIFIAAVGFLLSLAGVVGIWVAYAPARSSVTSLAATATHALETANNGLGRVNTLAQDARQS